MAKYQFIDVAQFKRGIYVFIGRHSEFVDWVTETFKNDKDYSGFVKYVREEEYLNPAGTFWYNQYTGDGVVELSKFPRTPAEIAASAHECLHAVFNMLDFLGINYDKQSSGESHCYLLEYFIFRLLTQDNYKTF